MPATAGTALIRPRPGAPGNTGRTRLAAAICSPGPRTDNQATREDLIAITHDDPRLVIERHLHLESERGGALRVLRYLFRRDAVVQYCAPARAGRRRPNGSAAAPPGGRTSYGRGCACGG